MEHVMNLTEEDFNDLKSGRRKRVYFLNDEKRKQVRIGDIIRFLKLPNLDDEFVVDVKNIEIFNNLHDCYVKYYEDDFQNKYSSIDNVIQDFGHTENHGDEKSNESWVAFAIKKHRIAHYNATACYLKKDNKVLMIKFTKKWGKVYAPPGGKFETGESPLDCIIREYYEETGLIIVNPKLQGISYWKDSNEGIIFVYVANEFEGKLTSFSPEGTLEWINLDDLPNIKQFDQNQKFTPYLFKNHVFEGKFMLDDNCKVLDYKIRNV